MYVIHEYAAELIGGAMLVMADDEEFQEIVFDDLARRIQDFRPEQIVGAQNLITSN